MRLYVWEGNGISDAYHDDGTLVVLADSPDHARQVARASAAPGRYEGWSDRFEWGDKVNPDVDKAIEREPDRVIELTTACVVAFNGGGYD